ncbi:Fic/DOC family protein [Maritalea mediterranea]|uniref:protein adenylyltransferase n=1 Tax=Maritalea mediterranea TaxID=2909667 RepID=A0ABS9E665_9HYPH|nr:Fic family protein [Maritalea mediterranea]MCF4098359.1 Fic family protein [Maritalea mediterranea]
MSRYNATEDPFCYPGTQVLINKAGLRDQDELDQFEQLMYLTRAEEPLPTGNLDYEHYKRIHHHFFQDVYDWAGQSREIRTGKGGNWFCFPEYIDGEMTRIFGQLVNEDHLIGLTNSKHFAERAAYYIAEINAIHPFREGNGRCQLTLLDILLVNSGFTMNEDQIDPDIFMQAMIASFRGDNGPLERAILDLMS